MAHTQIWNASFEAIPADNDQVSEGALRIRNLKRDIRERAEIDHDWDDVTDAGKHKKVTFVDPLGAKPTASADEGYLYTKDIAAKAELHWEDEDGNEVQVTSGGRVIGGIAAGTLMLFQQTAAPTGWTKQTTHNDKALRVVSGTAGSAGATAFTSVFGSGKLTGSHVLTIAQMPAHTHSGGSTSNANRAAGPSSNISGAATGSTGGDQGHDHTLSLDLQYVDVIIASRN
jgi:hypothetical protein